MVRVFSFWPIASLVIRHCNSFNNRARQSFCLRDVHCLVFRMTSQAECHLYIGFLQQRIILTVHYQDESVPCFCSAASFTKGNHGQVSLGNNKVSQEQGGEIRPGSCLAEEEMRDSSEQFMRKPELLAGRESNLYVFFGMIYLIRLIK